MQWTTKDTEPNAKPDLADEMRLTENSRVRISYSPWPMVYMSVDPPYDFKHSIDAADREGTRRRVLLELFPMAEVALIELRQAVEELESADDSKLCHCKFCDSARQDGKLPPHASPETMQSPI